MKPASLASRKRTRSIASCSGTRYDDRVVRARLAQAFGRLIRRAGDKGMFVLLSAATPSRLLDAFPGNVRVSRVPLDEAIHRVRTRLALESGAVHDMRERIDGAA